MLGLIDNHEKGKSSHVGDKLRSKKLSLSSINSLSSLDEKSRQEARFLFAGEEQKYNENAILEKVRDIFEPILNEVLSDLNFGESDSKFKKEGHGDPFINLFSEFWDYILNDYIQYERPIPFKKLTWKYDTNNRKEDIKALFEKPDDSLPDKASYYFPFISASSEGKFKQFLEKISTKTLDSKTLKEYSDLDNVDLVVPITSLSNGEYTSQFTVATLETYHYLVSPTIKGNKQKDTFLRNSGSSQNRRSCEDKDLRIPEISIEALTKETKETKE
ncbi:DUF3713 domain-containing protein, partial [Candidatus Mycoplasma haematobovis]|uniref:DUF3713 domain-containing protein n=1 Tax=Candidatus Mycoplasma haematobovis TaxID=432608 RepID=UPI000A752BFB